MSKIAEDSEIECRVRECLEERTWATAEDARVLIQRFRASGLELSIVGANRPVQVR